MGSANQKNQAQKLTMRQYRNATTDTATRSDAPLPDGWLQTVQPDFGDQRVSAGHTPDLGADKTTLIQQKAFQ